MINCFGILFCCFFLGFQMLSQQGNHIFHYVRLGETKYGISKKYGITIEQLEKFNPEIRQGLKEKMTLLIPENSGQPEEEKKKATTKAEPKYTYHEVKAGETLFSLSQTYGISILKIKEENPNITNGLKAGQKLKILLEEDKIVRDNGNYCLHKIVAGETAYFLAKKYHIGLDSLYLLNPEAENKFKIGQLLKFPKSKAIYIDKRLIEVKGIIPKPKDSFASDDDQFTNVELDTTKNVSDLRGYFLYKVKRGDSFYSLKKRYGVSRDKLIKLNPELQKGLTAKQHIIIPGEKEKTKRLNWLEKLLDFSEKKQPREADTLNTFSAMPELPSERSTNAVKTEDRLKINTDKNYLVGLMLPFHIPVVNDTTYEVGDNSKIALDFYNGFLMALDTLSKQGMNITLNVFDTKNSMFRIRELISGIKQAHFNLMVGPLYDDNVEFVADQLASEKVPVISPLSNSVEVVARPNLIQCISNEESKIVKIAELLNNNYSEDRIIFAHTNKTDEREKVKQIKARLRAKIGRSFTDNVTFTDKMLSEIELHKILHRDKNNVVVVVTDDKIFLSALIAKLRVVHDTSIHLIGSSTLLDVPTLEINYLDYLKLTMPDMSYIDYSDNKTIGFIETYRLRYSDEPNRFAFQGYDVGIYFLNKLWKNGSYFLQSFNGDSREMLGTGFEVRKTKDGGYKNNFLYMTAVRNLTLVRLKNGS